MSEADHNRPARPCPVCGKPAQALHRPFCSARCALLDLNRWLSGDYRIPTKEAPEDAAPEEDDG